MCDRPDYIYMRAAPGTPMFRPVCFVATSGDVRRTPTQGFVSLPDLMSQRPTGMRYLVAEVSNYNLPERRHTLDTWLIDMLDTVTTSDMEVMHLGWHKKYPDHDTAVMAALLRRKT